MMTTKLELGGIYKTEWDERPFRLIGFDDIEVFYDCLWPHDNTWSFSGNLKKKCYIYRISSNFFAINSILTDILPLTEEEFKAFRPDLPLRLLRTKKLRWNNFDSANYDEFLSLTDDIFDNNFLSQKLQVAKIVLLPYGNKGGLKKGSVISADNSVNFSCVELIWKAKEVQEAVNSRISDGIGIYRIGFEKGLPSYYIGGYYDTAGIIKRSENS